MLSVSVASINKRPQRCSSSRARRLTSHAGFHGNALGNLISGNDGRNVLTGLAGTDTLSGGAEGTR